MSSVGVEGEENDVVAMDDLQFNASLDVLLASTEGTTPFVEEATAAATAEIGGASVNSALSGVVPAAYTTIAAASPMAPASSVISTNPQQPLVHSAATTSQTLIQATLPVTAKTEADSTLQPSPLTARLNFPLSSVGMPPATAQHQPPSQKLPPQKSTSRRGKGGRSKRSTPPPSTSRGNRKRGRDVSSNVSEDEEEKNRRRMDRNLREQQRSHRITEQISHLREVLASSNIHFKPDKYSTLVSVVEYIKQLQGRSTMLDTEHKKLLETIKRTNDMVNNAYYQTNADGDTMVVGEDLLSEPQSLDDEHGVFVRGLDYNNVFKHCGVALAVASIDGKLMDCNAEFERLTKFPRNELMPDNDEVESPDAKKPPATVTSSEETGSSSQNSPTEAKTRSKDTNLSLFNVIAREDMEKVFLAMSEMLKQPITSDGSSSSPSLPQQDYWAGVVSQTRNKDTKLQLNISLVRSPRGNPKFFNCSVSASSSS